jgi:flagellar motor switch protein FliG
VIALVLSHLPPEQAGQVLAKFAPALQVEVLHRLIDLEETDGEILREIERALEVRLNQLVQAGRRRRAGLSAVRNIVEAADRHTRGQILGSLQLFDRELARQLAPPVPEFEDLILLDDLSLRELVAAAEPLVLQLAFVGVPDSFLRRVMALLPPQERILLKERIEELGPTALRDIDEARHRLCLLAQQLAAAGQIDLPIRPAVTLSG